MFGWIVAFISIYFWGGEVSSCHKGCQSSCSQPIVCWLAWGLMVGSFGQLDGHTTFDLMVCLLFTWLVNLCGHSWLICMTTSSNRQQVFYYQTSAGSRWLNHKLMCVSIAAFSSTWGKASLKISENKRGQKWYLANMWIHRCTLYIGRYHKAYIDVKFLRKMLV